MVDLSVQPAVVGPITLTDLVRYAGASGDFNPLHHDDAYAREAGYTGPFAMGMFSAGIVGAWAAERYGPKSIRRFRVRFDQQVWPGDVLSISVAAPPEPAATETGEQAQDIEVTCRSDRAGVVSRIWLTVVAHTVE
jgi:acyl dehydratase